MTNIFESLSRVGWQLTHFKQYIYKRLLILDISETGEQYLSVMLYLNVHFWIKQTIKHNYLNIFVNFKYSGTNSNQLISRLLEEDDSKELG